MLLIKMECMEIRQSDGMLAEVHFRRFSVKGVA
jgi:hypothetical protein